MTTTGNYGGAESVTNTESLATREREGGRPLVLMISLGSAPYREYLLRAISARFDIHAFLTTDPPWGREYLHSTTLLPSTLDGPAMARAALELNAKTPVSGVLCFDEARIHAASQVARELQLPNGEPETIRRMRDKGLTRAALDAANVAQPRSISVRTLEQAVDAATRLGYPVILKPRDLGASLGVVRVDSADELATKYSFTWSTRGPEAAPLGEDGSILVEECVIGEEISVDSAIQGGKVVPLFVARKVVGYPPFAEEIGHYVDAADPLLEDQELVGILQDSHAALGVMDGCTHTEIMLTADGPRIIEVNGRLGGDVIPYLGMLATGIDPGMVAASIACGIQPDLAATRSRVAGVRFFYVEREDTTIGSVTFRPEGLPAAVDRLVPIARAGAVVSPPPKGTWWGRVAYATVVADSREACDGAIAAAAQALSVTTS
jgi:hypothetical protein